MNHTVSKPQRVCFGAVQFCLPTLSTALPRVAIQGLGLPTEPKRFPRPVCRPSSAAICATLSPPAGWGLGLAPSMVPPPPPHTPPESTTLCGPGFCFRVCSDPQGALVQLGW